MTDLNAMGHLAGMQQRRQLAEQQARIAREQESRDRHLASQQAEVVRLLREQQEKEEAEKARLESLPKCPECISPVPTGAKRCPQCRIEIVSWDYVRQGRLAWRLICRPTEARLRLHERCSALASMAALFRDNCLRAMSAVDSHWQAEATQSLKAMMSLLANQSQQSRDGLHNLLKQWLAIGKAGGFASVDPGLSPPHAGWDLDSPTGDLTNALTEHLKHPILALPSEADKFSEQYLQIEARYANLNSLEADEQLPRTIGGETFTQWLGCGGFIGILSAFVGLLWFGLGADIDKPFGTKAMLVGVAVTAVTFICGVVRFAVDSLRRHLHARRQRLRQQQAAEMRAAKQASLTHLAKQRSAVNEKWKSRLEQGGYLKALSRLQAACDTSVNAVSAAWEQKKKMDPFLDALVDTVAFSESVGIAFTDWPLNAIAQTRALLAHAPMSVPISIAIKGDSSRIDRIADSLQEFRHALASLPVTHSTHYPYDDELASCLSTDDAGQFGAIAYSESSGAFGFAYRALSTESAKESALKYCAANDAKIVAVMRNGFCALATSSGNAFGWGTGETAEEAKTRALDACREHSTGNCDVKVCISSSSGEV